MKWYNYHNFRFQNEKSDKLDWQTLKLRKNPGSMFWIVPISMEMIWILNPHYRFTGKSFSEVLILALTNPQYDKRLSVEFTSWVSTWKFQAQNMGKTWVEHVVYISCSECQNKNKKQFVYTTCSHHVLPMFWACNFHVLNL